MYDIYNPTRAERVIYPLATSEPLRLAPGQTIENVLLAPAVLEMLRQRDDDLVVTERLNGAPLTHMAPILIQGMYGIGDNLHQRAALRELMKTHTVWLRSCHVQLYHDLIEQGLKVVFMPTRLRAQAKTIARERHLFHEEPPKNLKQARRIWYYKEGIDRHGSILEAMIAAFGLPPIDKPDFSFPIKDEWRDAASKLISQWKPQKPLLIYRPIIIRKEWDGQARNPDHKAFAELFHDIRERFFVVSVADLEPAQEWIVGVRIRPDVELHKGQLDFPTLAALTQQADMVWSPAGFAPVLAQAVGTPCITIYGGRESWKTTERAGQHLAPTLGIDPIQPCDCHSHRHACKKAIDVPSAKLRIESFIEAHVVFRCDGVAAHSEPVSTVADHKPQSVTNVSTVALTRSQDALFFGTTYVDCPERRDLTEKWAKLHKLTAGDCCDLLLVDSASPFMPELDGVFVEQFADNIGHLARHGRDGWGRAFTRGLQLAIDHGYRYAIHVEGDALCRLPIGKVLNEMRIGHIKVASTIVRGMTRDFPDWVETGMMVFDVEWLKKSRFIERYDWPNRTATPSPEKVIYYLIRDEMRLMPWRVWRDDRKVLSGRTIERYNSDWISHCDHKNGAYERYLELYGVPATPVPATPETPVLEVAEPVLGASQKLNFGCGDNRLQGWRNMDAEVDISKTLPFKPESASRILAEHVVEHVTYWQAIDFIKEAYRVLRPGGIFRIAVPSLERVGASDDPAYQKFSQKWQKHGPTQKGAMHAILYAHGHQTAWTSSLMHWTMVYVGFESITECRPGLSAHADLRGVEGHHRIIGDAFNEIETIVFEGTKPGGRVLPPVQLPDPMLADVAIVLGGSENAHSEFEAAKALVKEAGLSYTVVACNDQIAYCGEPLTACTLHPNKLADWLNERNRQGFPEPYSVWAHRKQSPAVTDTMTDQSGSSGMFCLAVARDHLKKHRIILAGVPMRASDGHFIRKQNWGGVKAFLGAWHKHKNILRETTRSMSGLTQELLGAPSLEWLKE